MLTEFTAWWLERLLSLCPARLLGWRARARNAMIIEPAEAMDGDAWPCVNLYQSQRRRCRTIGRFALDMAGATTLRAAVRASGRSGTIVLRLPSTELLEQSVVLPLAAERGLGQVLVYDMDRLTPFRADAVFWSWAVEQRDRLRGRVHVRLTLMPRVNFDPLIRQLAHAGVAPATIEIRAADGSTRSLQVARHPPQQRRRERNSVQAVAIGCGILAVTVVTLPFVLQLLAKNSVEQQIAAVQPAVAEAEALRRRIDSRATGADAVANQRARTGDALVALAAVTDILPDNTFLSEFDLTKRQITMSGQSTEAARLIAALSNDPSIRNPGFAAPVTRTGNNGADVFTIRAELAP